MRTSCNEDILPRGLGDRGNEGGCSRGLAGAIRLAPVQIKDILMKTNPKTNFIND